MSKTTIPTAGLADTAVTTAKITDANITTAKIADDAVTSAKATGFGKILSINTAQVTDSTTGTNTSYAEHDTDLRVSVTPQSTSSKFLITYQTKSRQTATSRFTSVRIYKSVDGGSFAGIEHDNHAFTGFNVSISDSHIPLIARVIHAPSTTSALIFTPYVSVNSGDWELGSRAAQHQTNMVVTEYE